MRSPLGFSFCVGSALCGFLVACQSATPVSEDDSLASLRAAFIDTTQRQAGPQYQARPMAQGEGFELAHASQQWSARLDAAGLTLAPSSAGWSFAMQLMPAHCQSDRESPTLTAAGNQVSYARRELTEWYKNGPLGLEQGFTVAANPCPAEPLRIDLALGGDLTAQRAANGITLRDRSGATALHYSDLYATDKSGKRIPAKMQLDASGQQLSLIVSDAEDQYPITIDPLLWTQQQRLTASDGASGDNFGSSVAILGDTAVIGAPYATTPLGTNSGAAYVFTRSGGVWSQAQKLTASDGVASDSFGFAVALSSDTMVVTALPSDSSMPNPGKAYVFNFNMGTGLWTQAQILTGSDGMPMTEDLFGNHVVVKGDTMIVTAASASYSPFTNAGEAYVFTRTGTTWSQMQKLDAGADAADNNGFGGSLDFDSGTVAIGSNVMSHSAVYVFVNSSGSFMFSQKLVSDDRTDGDWFGNSISLVRDTLLIGASHANLSGPFLAGAAYVFTRPTSTDMFSQQQKLVASDAASISFFGTSVAISGDMVLIGANSAGSSPYIQAGAVYPFRLSGTTYVQAKPLVATPRKPSEDFGTSLSVDGSTLFIGAPLASATAGAVYVFNGSQNIGMACSVGDDCSSGYCVDGVCCDMACGGSDPTDCMACAVAAGAPADGTCAPVTMASKYVCRPSAGACDVDDVCDGSSSACPMDAKVAKDTVCRAAADVCDLADSCDGLSNGCTDNKRPSTTVCRPAYGPCDVAENCTGKTDACPTDALQAKSVMCKAAGSTTCDPADFCDGAHKLCPAKYAPIGVSCGVAQSCNGLGLCR